MVTWRYGQTVNLVLLGTGFALFSSPNTNAVISATENQVAGAGSLVIVAISLFGGAWMNLKVAGGLFEAVGYALHFALAIGDMPSF